MSWELLALGGGGLGLVFIGIVWLVKRSRALATQAADERADRAEEEVDAMDEAARRHASGPGRDRFRRWLRRE